MELYLNENLTFNQTDSFFYNEVIGLLIYLTIAVILASVIIMSSYILSVQNPDSEKLSAYECGFEPYEDARHVFDVKFYTIAILFIIFDLETMFLLPWSVSLSTINTLGFWSMIDFMLELVIGFIYIWFLGALEWD